MSLASPKIIYADISRTSLCAGDDARMYNIPEFEYLEVEPVEDVLKRITNRERFTEVGSKNYGDWVLFLNGSVIGYIQHSHNDSEIIPIKRVMPKNFKGQLPFLYLDNTHDLKFYLKYVERSRTKFGKFLNNLSVRKLSMGQRFNYSKLSSYLQKEY